MPKSLAEYLGTFEPTADKPVAEAASDAPIDLELDALDGKAFAKKIVTSIEFYKYITHGLTLGTLPAAVVCRFMDHAWDKPVERSEVKVTRYQDMSNADIEQRLLELAMEARRLRDKEDGQQPPAVH